MKICHVITRLILGGAQENTVATVLGLARRGHDVTLIAGPSPGPEGKLFDMLSASQATTAFRLIEEPHLVRPLQPWHDAAAYRSLARHFAAERYDIVHTHSSKAGVIGRLAARAAHRAGITNVVHTIHGLAFDQYQPALLRALYIGIERWCARHSDALISVCDAMTKQALAAGVGQPEQFHTVYSGFDLAAFRAQRARRQTERDQRGISPETLVLMHIGRLFPMKGAEDFIEAVVQAQAAARQPVLGVLVGDGPLRPSLERRVRGISPAVRFTGLVPPGQIPGWLAAADVLVHASLREGLARTVVQALAAGVPVVTYDIGGVREIVRDGDNGCVCAAGDVHCLAARTADVSRDQSLRARLGAGAEATDLHRFDAEVMVEAIARVYDGVRSAACAGSCVKHQL